jgi:hypothetical protein
MSKVGLVKSLSATIPDDNEIVATRDFMLKCTYDFAVDGGAIGDINLIGATDIPSGALLRDAVINVLTVPTSGGAPTIAIYAESAADIQAAAAISGAPWSTTGYKAASALKAGANPIKTTAARDIKATIATATLTAGKFEIILTFEAPGL